MKSNEISSKKHHFDRKMRPQNTIYLCVFTAKSEYKCERNFGQHSPLWSCGSWPFGVWLRWLLLPLRARGALLRCVPFFRVWRWCTSSATCFRLRTGVAARPRTFWWLSLGPWTLLCMESLKNKEISSKNVFNRKSFKNAAPKYDGVVRICRKGECKCE